MTSRQDSHAELRRRAIEFIRANPDYFLSDIELLGYPSVEMYWSTMSQPGIFGDAVLLMTSCLTENVSIKLFTWNSHQSNVKTIQTLSSQTFSPVKVTSTTKSIQLHLDTGDSRVRIMNWRLMKNLLKTFQLLIEISIRRLDQIIRTKNCLFLREAWNKQQNRYLSGKNESSPQLSAFPIIVLLSPGLILVWVHCLKWNVEPLVVPIGPSSRACTVREGRRLLPFGAKSTNGVQSTQSMNLMENVFTPSKWMPNTIPKTI